jgi:hypothetical protein
MQTNIMSKLTWLCRHLTCQGPGIRTAISTCSTTISGIHHEANICPSVINSSSVSPHLSQMADVCAYYDWQPPKRRQALTPQAARRLAAGSSTMSLQELAMQHELGRLRTRTTAGGALPRAPSASDLAQNHACSISAWQQSGRHAQRHSMAEISFDPASAVLPSAKHARSTPTSPRCAEAAAD